MAEKSWQTALIRAGEEGRIVLKRDPGHTIVGKVGVVRTASRSEDTTFRVGGMSTITIDQDEWEFQVEMELLPTHSGSLVFDTVTEVYWMRNVHQEWVCSDTYQHPEAPGTFLNNRIKIIFDAGKSHE